MFENRLDRFEDNDVGNESRRTLKSESQEIENKLRWEVNQFFGDWKVVYGLSAQYVKYNNDFFARIAPAISDSTGAVIVPQINLSFYNAIDFARYGAFVSINKKMFGERLSLTGGIRTDMNSFTTTGNNPLNALSPRVAASFAINEKWNMNASVDDIVEAIYAVMSEGNPARFPRI